MPQVVRYKVVASVEIAVEGPYAYAEAVALAEERLGRLRTGEHPLNGIKQVQFTAITAERKG